MMATNEIFEVQEYIKVDGERIVHCPHCRRGIGLESGPFKGEQYTDKVCGGMFQISFSPRQISVEEFEKAEANHE